jgi:hypothetical protein
MHIFVTVLHVLLYSAVISAKMTLFQGMAKYLEEKKSSVFDEKLCVSSHLHSLIESPHKRSNYPMDIFDYSISSPHDEYACFFRQLPNEKHTCSSSSSFFCPMKTSYLPTVLKQFENASTDICHTLNLLEGKLTHLEQTAEAEEVEEIQVIVFGGSVTAGIWANGCFEGEGDPKNGPYPSNVRPECAWHASFVNYLQQRFVSSSSSSSSHRQRKLTLKLVNLAVSGTTSCYMEKSLQTILEERKITLHKHDIILLDYSVNDGAVFANSQAQTDKDPLYACVTSLLKQFHVLLYDDEYPNPHSRSPLSSSLHFLPTIILLEFWPFVNNYLFRAKVDTSYHQIYTQIAKEFHIPLISYRDLYWSEEYQSDLAKYPIWERLVKYDWCKRVDPGRTPGDYIFNIHPPWAVHDFFADLLALAFEELHEFCNIAHKEEKEKEQPPSSSTALPNDKFILLNAEEEEKLFHKLIAIKSNALCLPHHCSYLIKEIARNQITSFLSAETTNVLPYEWKLYQDRVGKAGWIIQGNFTEKEIEEHLADSVSIHNYKFMIGGRLNFSVDSSLLNLTTPITPTTTAVLSVTYMQTYLNAGSFRVLVCNHTMNVPGKAPLDPMVDTLIQEKYSNLEIEMFEFNVVNTCESAGGEGNSRNITVSIEHLLRLDNFVSRNKQKVKIAAVTLTVTV